MNVTPVSEVNSRLNFKSKNKNNEGNERNNRDAQEPKMDSELKRFKSHEVYLVNSKNATLTKSTENKKPLKKHFRIILVDGDTNLPSKNNSSNIYYCIEDKDFHKRIGVINMEGGLGLKQSNDNTNKIDDNFLWKIIPIFIDAQNGNQKYKRIYYYIQNKANRKYLTYIEDKNNKGALICNYNETKKLNYNNYFILNKMYRERNPYESLELIDKEPIDVLIKYIDLSDPNLNREGINQIKKDEENGEIIFSIRSILKYIPWVRKIFILMPNEKIKYFKEPEEIKNRIIYVKDKDLIGFDSASSVVFQFNLWRMKEYGLSENFILMDDDYFIGKPLKKYNFFYEENGIIYPALITGDYYELSKSHLEKTLKPLLDPNKNKGAHSANGFSIMQKSTLLFLYSIFGDDFERNGLPLIEASFTHNAIPVKQSYIKEIYDHIIKLYPYAKETLESKDRHIKSLQPQTLYMSYVKNKYNQRVKIIKSRFFDLMQFKGKINSELFVINTSDRKYLQKYFINEISQLKLLYSEISPYENNMAVQKLEEKIKSNNKNQQSNKNQKNNKNLKPNENEKKKENKNLKPNENKNENEKRENEMKFKNNNRINIEF